MTHKTVIVGYKYSLGVHMTLCHGPIDGIEEIRVAERTAWEGDYTGSGSTPYQELQAGTISDQGGVATPGKFRRDRMVLDLDSLESRAVIGTEADTRSGATAPPTPAGSISLATVLTWGGVAKTDTFPIWFTPDNTDRVASNFENPGKTVLDGDPTTIGSGSVTSSTGLPGLGEWRRDRVVIDVASLGFEYIEGAVRGVQEYAEAPVVDNGKISLAVVEVFGGDVGQDNYSVSVDNTRREAQYFDDADNDFQLSFDSYSDPLTPQQGTFTYSVSAGTIEGDSNTSGTGTGDLWVTGPTNGTTTPAQFDVSEGAVDTGLVGSSLFIDKPDLFGGERNEGGIRGRVSVALGTATQGVNEYLQRVLGSVPAFRHVAALVLEQVYVGTTGRVKPWAVTTRRAPVASGLDSQYASIGPDANPAHILYELVRSSDFGMGYSEARIETAEFEAAAQTLHGEDFGLSLLWRDAREDVEAFRRRVCDHIDASMYVDPDTAKFRLKLHRDDYVTGDLPLLDRSNVVEVIEFGRPGYGELVNKVSLIYTDGEEGPEGERPSWKQKAVTQHDLGALRAQGGRVISKDVTFSGICKAGLANKVLSRELRQRSRPLARAELILSSDESDIRPGDVRRWSDSEYGVEQIVIRVLEVKYGTIRDRRVRVKAVEDIFGTVDAVYADPTPTQWTEPVQAPAPAPYRRLMEATYLHYAEALDESATLLGEVPDDRARLVTQAVGPAENTFGYEVQIDDGSGYHPDDDEGEHCPTALLARVTGPTETLLVFQQGDSVELDSVDTDTWAYLGDEIVAVRSIDPVANTATVDRGVIDTVPTEHPVGTRIFFGEGFETYSAHTYTDGDQVDVKILPTTGGGTLELANAPADTITFAGRFIRPYPPGNVKIAGERYPDLLEAPLTVTWAHRDRTQQTSTLVAQDAGDIGPEAGTTYTIRVIDRSNGQQLHEETGVTGTSYDDSDGADTLTPTSAPVQIRIELLAQRDGYDSWQTHQIDTDRRGYAFCYEDADGNLDYGGFAANA